MYLVTTRTPTKVTATEYWYDELKAYLRGDVINAMTNQDTGALVEEITVPDIYKIEGIGFEIKYTWMDKRQLSEISCLIEVTPDIHIHCELDVRLDINGDDLSYVIELSDTIYQDEEQGEVILELNRKTVELLQELISEDSREREYFDQHNCEEVTEANRKAFDDSNQNPNTI